MGQTRYTTDGISNFNLSVFNKMYSLATNDCLDWNIQRVDNFEREFALLKNSRMDC